jgi:hypothetical protein
MSLGGIGFPWRTPDEVRADHDWAPEPKLKAAQLDNLKPPSPPQIHPPPGEISPPKPAAGQSDTNGKVSTNGKASNTSANLAGTRSGRQAYIETMRTRWLSP